MDIQPVPLPSPDDILKIIGQPLSSKTPVRPIMNQARLYTLLKGQPTKTFSIQNITICADEHSNFQLYFTLNENVLNPIYGEDWVIHKLNMKIISLLELMSPFGRNFVQESNESEEQSRRIKVWKAVRNSLNELLDDIDGKTYMQKTKIPFKAICLIDKDLTPPKNLENIKIATKIITQICEKKRKEREVDQEQIHPKIPHVEQNFENEINTNGSMINPSPIIVSEVVIHKEKDVIIHKEKDVIIHEEKEVIHEEKDVIHETQEKEDEQNVEFEHENLFSENSNHNSTTSLTGIEQNNRNPYVYGSNKYKIWEKLYRITSIQKRLLKAQFDELEQRIELYEEKTKDVFDILNDENSGLSETKIFSYCRKYLE